MSRFQLTIFIISIAVLLAGVTYLIAPQILTPATTKAPAPAVKPTTTQKTAAKKVPKVDKAGAGEKVIILSKLGMT